MGDPSIIKNLPFDFVILGSFFELMNMLKIDVRLLDAKTGKIILAQSIESEPDVPKLNKAINTLSNKLYSNIENEYIRK